MVISDRMVILRSLSRSFVGGKQLWLWALIFHTEIGPLKCRYVIWSREQRMFQAPYILYLLIIILVVCGIYSQKTTTSETSVSLSDNNRCLRLNYYIEFHNFMRYLTLPVTITLIEGNCLEMRSFLCS